MPSLGAVQCVGNGHKWNRLNLVAGLKIGNPPTSANLRFGGMVSIYLLAAGKIAAHGAPADLARGESPWTKQFFAGEADGPVPFHYPAPDYAAQLGLAGAKS